MFGGDGFHHLGDGQVALAQHVVRQRHLLARARHAHGIAVARGQRGAVVLARQHAHAQRRPGRHAQAQGVGHGQQVALYGALHQAVFDLQRDQRRPAAQVGQRLHARHLPGRRVGDARIDDLAGAHQVVKAAHHLFHGGGVVPDVQVQQVDVVGVQTLQAGFHAAHHALAVVAAAVGVAGVQVQAVLGGQHRAVALARHETAQQGFAAAAGVEVGGVHKVAAALGVQVEHAARLGLVGAPAPVGAEGHGAQRQRADAQAAAAQGDVVGQCHFKLLANVELRADPSTPPRKGTPGIAQEKDPAGACFMKTHFTINA